MVGSRWYGTRAMHRAARAGFGIRPLDRPASAAVAPPREADAAQAPAAQHVIAALKPHRTYDYVVSGHSGEPTA